VENTLQTRPESCRPFLPAKDFDLSKRFYEALGFTKELDGDVAIFRVGATRFILQNRFEQRWAENLMMQLMVDDLDDWWAKVEGVGLSERFSVPAPKKPELQPWGLRVGYIVDPSGVLWHVAQRRRGIVHDE
jgi:glyoxalase/bleomycin resistance protein/dioxygenase superfamily protein